MTPARVAWLSYIRRRWNLLLICLPVVVLFSLVTLALSLEQSLREMAGDASVDLRSLRVVSLIAPFPRRAIEEVARLPSVSEVSPMMSVRCPSPDGRGSLAQCVGVTPAFLKVIPTLVPVPPEAIARWTDQKNGALVSADLARRHGWREGSLINFTTDADATAELTVTAVGGDGPEDRLLMHSEYADHLTGGSGATDRMWLLVDEPGHRAQVIDAIERQFANTAWPAECFPGELAKASATLGARLLISLLRAAGAMALLVAFAISLATITLSIDARRRELAALRAIGWRRSHVRRLVVVESMLLLGPSAAVGAIFAHLAFHRSGVHLTNQLLVRVPLWVAIGSAALGFILGALGGLLASRRATSGDVLENLR